MDEVVLATTTTQALTIKLLTIVINTARCATTTTLVPVVTTNIVQKNELCFCIDRIIISLVEDSIIPSIIHLIDPQATWQYLRSICNVKSLLKCLSIKE